MSITSVKASSLVDVTEQAAVVGWAVPVLLTQRVWDDCVAWDGYDSECAGQGELTEEGRLVYVLQLALSAARRNRSEDRVDFTVYRVPRRASSLNAHPVKLSAVLSVGATIEHAG